jgi:cytochrome b involved in lipid metabolism
MTMHLRTQGPTRTPFTGGLAVAAVTAAMLAAGAVSAPAALATTAPGASAVAVAQRPAALVSTRTYTKSTVAKHHTASDCWTIVDGKVYNLTKFVAKHPGGRKRIIRMCGRDGSAAFHGQHSSGSRAGSVVLARYKIGTLR